MEKLEIKDLQRKELISKKLLANISGGKYVGNGWWCEYVGYTTSAIYYCCKEDEDGNMSHCGFY